MLSLITQSRDRKIDLKHYYYQHYDFFGTGKVAIYGWDEIKKDTIILGIYDDIDRAEQIFKNMIKAEQEQNSIKNFEKVLCDLNISLKGTQVLSTQKSSIEIPMAKKDFKIFKMPNK